MQLGLRDLHFVLRGEHDGLDADGAVALVADGDLRLAVGAQVRQHAGLAHLGEALCHAVREPTRQRVQLGCLVDGVAEHDALIARAQQTELVDLARALSGLERALDADDAASALAALRAEWLDELARPNVPSLSRLVALMQPDCPPGRLAKAQRSVWWPERCAIADNPNTPLSTVRRLADDANVVVRAAAREALAQRQADGEL